MNLFKSKSPHYEHLRKKWGSKNKELFGNLFDKHLRKVAVGSLGGLMLLSTPGMSVAGQGVDQHQTDKISAEEDKNRLLVAELLDKVPEDNSNLDATQEQAVSQLLSKRFGLTVLAEQKGIRLNRTYGLIGGEQHLYRYPGDNLFAHAKDTRDWAMFGGSGIAPGLGAWGYFAPSKDEFTPKDEERERWYVVAQTFLSPGFEENPKKYTDFYKYKKILVVNPKTGQAIVGDMGDAGPGQSTGKSFGGSPEVMHAIGLASGPRKGEVIFMFIDDPNDQVPLGPIKVKDDSGVKLAKS
jgi:hypothetical protein